MVKTITTPKSRRPFEERKAINMQFDILTIFPRIFDSYLGESMIKRAASRSLLKIKIHDVRTFSKDKHKKTDNIPYGGGAGMVMTPQPLYDTIQHAKKGNPKAPVIYLTPTGKTFTQKTAERLSKRNGIILICGRYEGIDQRIRDLCVDEEISIGKYVLTGGELPAMVILDAISRFVPGVIGKEESVAEETFSKKLGGKKEYPHYTRPPEFMNLKVPEVLISGHHAKIEQWRKEQLS